MSGQGGYRESCRTDAAIDLRPAVMSMLVPAASPGSPDELPPDSSRPTLPVTAQGVVVIILGVILLIVGFLLKIGSSGPSLDR